MSSTNRSNSRDSHISDYYVTPSKPIFDLFDALKGQEETSILFTQKGQLNPLDKYLDPCAGGDEHNEMSYPMVISQLKQGDSFISTIDIREDSKAEKICDFLTIETVDTPKVIITNPPFNIAKEIILKSFDLVEEGGFIIMLLRLNFFGSKDRKEFWENNMPILTFVHSKRISFTKGKTDSIEYMHCVWKKGISQNYTKLMLI